MNGLCWGQKRSQQPQPEQAANFEEIGPENDHANFLSVHLRNRYAVNMGEAQQTGRYSPLGDENVRISHMHIGWNEIYTANRGIGTESIVQIW